MKKLLGRGDIEDGLMRLDTLTNVEVRTVSAQLLSAAHPADNRVRVMVDKGLDSKHNVVAVDRRGRVRSRESTIDDGIARAVVVIGVQRSSICYEGCFDHGTLRWQREKGSCAADSQR
jgi:hypothetical protein